MRIHQIYNSAYMYIYVHKNAKEEFGQNTTIPHICMYTYKGPDIVGSFELLQSLADGMKLIQK